MYTILSRIVPRLSLVHRSLLNCKENNSKTGIWKERRCYCSKRISICVEETVETKRIMDRKLHFIGEDDHHNGVTVDSSSEGCENFADFLSASLERWRKQKKYSVWFRVHLQSSEWIPHLVREGFKFHHAKEEYVMLYLWLPEDVENRVPPYAHTNLGVGGFVFNDETGEILVVKDKRSILAGPPRWKLPGGFIEPGENIPEAAIREVREETSVLTEFESLVGFRHMHGYNFGCSDIYIIARLRPLTRAIQKCEHEIADCTWMKLEDYASDPNLTENNRIISGALVKYVKNRTALKLIKGTHPLSKEPISIYLFNDDVNSKSAS